MKTRLLTVVIAAIAVVGCEKNGNEGDSPKTTDYSSSTNWFQTGKEIDPNISDVFYLIPTAGEDWVDENGVTHHLLDVTNPDHRATMDNRFGMAYPIFGDGVNFFSPYYRQITLQVWANGQQWIDQYYPTAFADVKAAFDYYMKHWNGGRDFVLAGFSQGAKGVKELVKSMTDEQFRRMRAAYVIGFPVLQEDLDATDRFVPAQGAADTGVTISWNSVTDEAGIGDMFRNSKMIINPVNWSTGTETAQIRDGVSNQINKENMMLYVDGIDPSDAYNPAMSMLFPLGNLHLMELPLYGDFIRENIKLRLYGE